MILGFLFFLFSFQANAEATVQSSPSPSVVASPIVSPVPSSSPAPVKSNLGFFDRKKLEFQFSRAQSIELDALKHRLSTELNELKYAQKAHYNEWFEKEKASRREFFKTHSKSDERRTYVQNLGDRRKALLKMQDEERARRVQENDVHLKAAKEDQATRKKEFRAALARGERPASSLWPQNHY